MPPEMLLRLLLKVKLEGQRVFGRNIIMLPTCEAFSVAIVTGSNLLRCSASRRAFPGPTPRDVTAATDAHRCDSCPHGPLTVVGTTW